MPADYRRDELIAARARVVGQLAVLATMHREAHAPGRLDEALREAHRMLAKIDEALAETESEAPKWIEC